MLVITPLTPRLTAKLNGEICPFANDVGGLQTLHEMAGAVQPPPAVHVRVTGEP